jgi:hypothetical protein
MDIMNIKLKNGEDLIAQLVEDHTNTPFIRLKAPIKLISELNTGIYAKNWMYYSSEDEVVLQKVDIFFITIANDDSVEWYVDYVTKNDMSLDMESDIDSLENIFSAMIESKTSIKH